MMDTMCVRVQDHLNSLRFSESSLVQEDVKVAQNLMKDAKSSKTVRPHLLRETRNQVNQMWEPSPQRSCCPACTT